MVSATPSVLSNWVRVLLNAFRAQGGDVPQLLATSGFAVEVWADPNARHPVRDVARLWHAASALATDPAFSLRVPRYACQTTFYALGYAMLASATLGEALGRALHYSQIVTDAGALHLEHVGDAVQLRLTPNLNPAPASEAFRDSLLALVVHGLNGVSPGTFTLRKVEIAREQPMYALYERHFGCQVVSSRTPHQASRRRSSHLTQPCVDFVDALWFDAELLKRALPSANPELARHNDAALREYSARMQAGSLVDRVRTAIAARAKEEVSPELIARSLGMSVRSLQRNLQELGTSYEELSAQVKCERACAYLRNGRYTITQVAGALGYDSLSAFTRAFKRWTGRSPSEYQQDRADISI